MDTSVQAARPEQTGSNLTRRTLLQTGWVLPAVLAVGLPATARAGGDSDSDSDSGSSFFSPVDGADSDSDSDSSTGGKKDDSDSDSDSDSK